jgi:hypothetical protein
MGNLRPFKLFSVALLKPLKYGYFIEKSTESIAAAALVALKCGPSAVSEK